MITYVLAVLCVALAVVAAAVTKRNVSHRVRYSALTEHFGAQIDLLTRRQGDKRNPEMRLTQAAFHARNIYAWAKRQQK